MLSVIIVNFNAGNLLCQCLQAILAAPEVDQVIVSDNGSTDGSLQRVEALFSSDSRFLTIANGSNLGFARANNLALKKLSPQVEYVLFLNPDCLVPEATLKRMKDFMDLHSEVGMAGCFIANPDGSEQRGDRRRLPTPWNSLQEIFSLFNKISRPSSISFNLAGGPLPAEPVEVEAISGAFMLVRRSAVDDVGGLDENYFLHCEDLDWCKRFNLAGWKIYFVPDAKVLHHQGTCSRKRVLRVSWYKHCGMLRFYRKFYRDHYGFGLFILAAVVIWLRFVMTIPISLLASWRDRESCAS